MLASQAFNTELILTKGNLTLRTHQHYHYTRHTRFFQNRSMICASCTDALLVSVDFGDNTVAVMWIKQPSTVFPVHGQTVSYSCMKWTSTHRHTLPFVKTAHHCSTQARENFMDHDCGISITRHHQLRGNLWTVSIRSQWVPPSSDSADWGCVKKEEVPELFYG